MDDVDVEAAWLRVSLSVSLVFFFARGAIKYFCICLCIAGYLPLSSSLPLLPLCVCVRMLLCLYLCTLYKHMLIGRN